MVCWSTARAKPANTFLEDVARGTCCTTTSMHVAEADGGVVAGCLTFMESDSIIDCLRMGASGKAVPLHTSHVSFPHGEGGGGCLRTRSRALACCALTLQRPQVSNIQSTAQHILVVKRRAVFSRLQLDRFF